MRFLPPRLVLATLTCAAAVPAVPAAHAARPQPLRDLPPGPVERFSDRILGEDTKPRARAAASPRAAFATRGGYSVEVSFSSTYGLRRETGRSYVSFLDSLPHGSELRRLRVHIAPPSEVRRICDGGDGVLACYSPAAQRMVVPGTNRDARTGVSTSYVVAHEYGHHVARNRSNAPLSALNFGPKFWASEELVCRRIGNGRLSPTPSGNGYLRNPGENWAEVYARLRYPDLRWRFTDLLRPDAAALDAARRDVLDPWTTYRSQRFAGAFAADGADTQDQSFSLRLDGTLTIRLRGPDAADLDLAVISDGRTLLTRRGAGSDHEARFKLACRDEPIDGVTLRVTRRSGTGPYSLTAVYAG